MARQHPKKRHLFKFGKSRSTSSLSPAPLQASAADICSTAEISTNPFRGKLARMRRFLQQSNRSQPCSVTSEQVGTSADGGTQEQQGQSQAVPSQDNQTATNEAEPQPVPGVDGAARGFNNTTSMSGLSAEAADIIDGANTAFNEIQTLTDTYAAPLRLFNQTASSLSVVHPYAQMALGILKAASQLLLNQVNLDNAVSSLLQTIQSVYGFLTEEDTIKNIDNMKDTLAKIARVISDSVQFIQDYSKTKKFWKRMGKNILSETQDIVGNYTTTLNNLIQEYRDRTVRDIQINVYRLLEDLNLEGMAYANAAGLDTAKICLDGTRVEVLRCITDWINDPRIDAPRIMWLQGQAGRGKSAIAHTIAAWTKNVGGLGSCFCFARDRLSEHREEKILTTIARDLADRDSAFRRALADVVSKDYSLKTTGDVKQQWERLILEPLSKVNGVIVGNVAVVIDALDESGPETSRSRILSLLTSPEAGQLPANFRILLTSRLLPDIADALRNCQHVTVTSLDEVPLASAEHDIHLFVSSELRDDHLKGVIGPNEIDLITRKSEGLFEWARLSCQFIKYKRAGRTLRERFADIITVRAGGGTLLDKTYTTMLEGAIPRTDAISLARFHSVMQQILITLTPLPMSTLQVMRNDFPNGEDRYDVIVILEFMAPIMAGVTDSSPVRPFHASFYDFLTDASRSGDYFINTSEPYDLAYASLQILCRELQFNVCRLESSYLSNSEVSDLQDRINRYITPQLSYSCQFWAQHLRGTTFDTVLAELVRRVVGNEKILFWLETLSIIGATGKAIDALVCTESWLLGHVEFEDALRMIQDGIKFIQIFGSAISHSTPHLYLSALPLAPSNARLTKELMPQFSHLVGVPTGGLIEWGAALLALLGHVGPVHSVAFSPDGKRIVSASGDRTVRVWDAERGIQIGSPLQGHTCQVLSAVFSPDSKRIVSGSHDKTVRVWDAEQGVHIGSPLQGHTDQVWSVAFSPDGKRIASGSHDNTVRVWDAEKGVQIGNPFQGHTGGVHSVAFSPDGRRIVSGSDDNTVRVWDAQRGIQISSPLWGHTDNVWSVGFSPDGKRIVSGSHDKTVRVWDAEEGVHIGSPLQGHTNQVLSVEFSLDGMKIVSGSADLTVRVWDVESGVQIGSPLQGHAHGVWSAQFSPDGKRIVSGSEDHTVRVWDTEGCMQTDGSFVQGHAGIVHSLAFSPDGKRIVSGSDDNTVRVWNAESGVQVSSPLQGHGRLVHSVGFSPDGKRIVSGSRDTSVRVWDAEKGVQIGNPFQGHTDEVNSVAFSPEGRRIVSGSDDNTVRVWDAEKGVQIGNSLQGHTDEVWSVAFSPDGERIASGSKDKTVRVWDAGKSMQIGKSFQGHTDGVNSVAFSPDGRKLASGSDDMSVRVWDAERGLQIGRPLWGHTHQVWSVNRVWSVMFSPDGKRIVSGSGDITVRVWDAERAVELYCLAQGHTGPVCTVAFSVDGKRIASGSFDGTIRIWDTQICEAMVSGHDQLQLSPCDSTGAFASSDPMAGACTTSTICFSSVPSHALCDSEQLLDGFKPENAKDWYEPVNLYTDGWFRGPEGRLLLWLPLTFRRPFDPFWTVAVIPRDCCTELDMSHMVHGDKWHKCFKAVD